ncbi:MAG: hypothetical protein Q4D22_03295 [Candidatus Saccharibacteria bacterium]|jgi:hypothetical protein|nr:hypothetical protein [Candidatus Saccharibacteria bacterium]
MPKFANDNTLQSVRHDLAAYGLPFSKKEASALRADWTLASVLDRGNVEEVDQIIASLFADYHAKKISPQTFSDQYGIWIRLRKTICN